MTDPSPTAPSVSLTRRDAHAATEFVSEPFFRRLAELAMSALRISAVAIRTAPDTLWVATRDDPADAPPPPTVEDSTLLRRLLQQGDTIIEDVWAAEQYTALVDLEQFPYRFVACRTLTDAAGAPAGQLCVLDTVPRTLEAHHLDVLHTLAQMAQSELERQQEAARRRRGEALQGRLERVLQMIARDEPVEVTLEALMYLMEGQLPGLVATMHWLDPVEQVLRPVAAPSMPTALVEATDGLPADAEAGSIGAAIHDGEAVLDEDAAASIHWPAMRAAVQDAGLTHSWSVPVRSAPGHSVLGAVTLFSRDELVPTDELRQAVQLAAQLAALALERDRDRSLLEQTQGRHQRFMHQANEGLYRIELHPPVRTDQSLEAQIRQVFERAHIAESNPAFAHQHGFQHVRDILGRPLLDLYGEGQDLAQLPILRAIDHDYHLEEAQSCEVDQQGRERWFLNTLHGAVDNGRLMSFWGSQREVTQEKHTAYALRESDHRYQALVRMIPTPVIIHTEDAIEAINPAGARWLGAASPDAVEGRPLSDFMQPDDIERLVAQAPPPDAPVEAEFTRYPIQAVDGRRRSVEMASRHILYGGQPAVLTVAQTARPGQLAESASEAQADSATPAEMEQLKSAFSGTMGHEIRTPLTALIGFAEILADEIDHPSDLDRADLARRIQANGQRLLWTLDSILNLARVEAGTLELQATPFEVIREVEALVEGFAPVAREQGATLRVEAEGPAIYAALDRTAFERVVGNVLAAALRDQEGGMLTVTVDERRTGPMVAVDLPPGTTPSLSPSAGDGAPVGATPSAIVVQALLARMGGTLRVRTPDGEGPRYEVQFQTASPSRRRASMRLLSRGAMSAA